MIKTLKFSSWDFENPTYDGLTTFEKWQSQNTSRVIKRITPFSETHTETHYLVEYEESQDSNLKEKK